MYHANDPVYDRINSLHRSKDKLIRLDLSVEMMDLGDDGFSGKGNGNGKLKIENGEWKMENGGMK